MNNEKIHKIMDLCLKAKKRGHDCFLNYSGHVDTLRFHIYLFGWSSGIEPDYKIEVKLTHPNADEEFDAIIGYLEGAIETDDKGIKINNLKAQFNSILKCNDTNLRDYDLSSLLTKIEREFSIPAYKDEAFNAENPDVMELYYSVSNERSFVKELMHKG